MTDARQSGPHLTDAEIDAYWKEQMSAGDEQRVEQHLLDCADCQQRVELIEVVVDQLAAGGFRESRRLTYWRVAAIFFAGVSLLALVQWIRSPAGSRGERVAIEAVDAPLLAVHLAPPTRDAGMPEVAVSQAAVVMFVLDAREGGAPGTRFDVRLARADGQPLMQWSALTSGADGAVRVPVGAAQLAGGGYMFDLQAGAASVNVPFVVRP
jgi:hypothetical protein